MCGLGCFEFLCLAIQTKGKKGYNSSNYHSEVIVILKNNTSKMEINDPFLVKNNTGRTDKKRNWEKKIKEKKDDRIFCL